MKIKIWGCRGSIPAPGFSTLRYGGNSTCIELRPEEGGILIIDAGSGIRLLGKEILKDKSINDINIFLTHSHWDHINGFPFFTPAYFAKYKINVYGGPNDQAFLKKYFAHQMSAPFFPVDFSLMKAQFAFGPETPDIGRIGNIHYTPILLSHPNGGYGFKFEKNGKTFVFLTDNEPLFPHVGGLSRDKYVEFCKGADVLLHDAQYTDEEYKVTKGWGHSTFADATQIAIDAGVKRFGLFHHDPDRTDDDLDVQLEKCKLQIKNAGADIECFAAAEGMEIEL